MSKSVRVYKADITVEMEDDRLVSVLVRDGAIVEAVGTVSVVPKAHCARAAGFVRRMLDSSSVCAARLRVAEEEREALQRQLHEARLREQAIAFELDPLGISPVNNPTHEIVKRLVRHYTRHPERDR